MSSKWNRLIFGTYHIIFSCLSLSLILLTFMFFIAPDYSLMTNSMEFVVYLLVSIIPLVLIGALATKKYKKDDAAGRKIMITWLALLVCFILILLFANYWSSDYTIYLKHWCDQYSELNFNEAFVQTTHISNYTPVYNYYLIIITKLGINTLFGIKYLTFLFSILLAFVMEKIISMISKNDFSFIRFVLLLLIPPILIEYTSWGQCDAIYVSFCLLSVLFALKHRSKLSFMFLGLAFAFKLQFLFIVPLLFLFLIVRDENGERYIKWKDVWIVFVMYLVNIVPVFFGAGLDDVLFVYFRQSVYDNRLSGNCPNICYPLMLLCNGNTSAIVVMGIIQTVFTLALCVFLLYHVIKYLKGVNYVIDCQNILFIGFVFSFIMVFFMPKMLDRFYFIAMCLIWIIALLQKTHKEYCLCGLITLAEFIAMFPTICYLNQIEEVFVLGGFVANMIALVIIVYTLIVKYREKKQIKIKAE